MRKGNSLSKSVMAARTRPIGSPVDTHQDFESMVSDFMEKHAFKAREQSPLPLPTTVVLTDLSDGTPIYDGPTGKFFKELLPDLPDDVWFDVTLLHGTDTVGRFHAGKKSLIALRKAVVEREWMESQLNRQIERISEPYLIRKRKL